MTDEKPTVGSLFAGIGGIDLGLERAGWDVRWQVEWDPFCQHVLAHHWPDVPRYGDIAAVDWDRVEPVDLLAGGFPCQPVSHAGRRIAQDDERWLWPEFLRAVRALRPRVVLVENVPNLLAINGGSAFGEVLGGLAEGGYDAEWDCIPAAAVGAVHLRDRVWIVAYPNDVRLGSGEDEVDRSELPRGWPPLDEPGPGRRTVADPDGTRPQGHGRLDREWDRPGEWTLGPGRWPVNDWWDVEPHVGRLAHGVSARVDQLRALGNAVVPQVVEALDPILRERLRMTTSALPVPRSRA